MTSPLRWFRPSKQQRGRELGLLTLSLIVFGCGDRIPDFSPEELAETTDQVREAYRLQDYEFGAELGEEWASWAPDALELRAWTVANFCGAGLTGIALGMAKEMAADHPTSPWSSLALGMARFAAEDQDYAEEALEASEKALLGLPDLIEAVILRGQTLFLFRNPDSAINFVRTLPESQMTHPDVQITMALGRFEEGLDNIPPEADFAQALNGLMEEAHSTCEEVLQEHPAHLSANLAAAQLSHDPVEASKYVRTAASQTFSPAAHLLLWHQIKDDPTLSETQKAEEIEADVRKVMENGGESVARSAALAIALGSEGLSDLQAELDAKVLNEHREGWAAEMILMDRIRALSKEIWGAPSLVEGWDKEKKDRLSDMIEDFENRKRHYDPEALLNARWAAFLMEREVPGADPETLRQLAKGVTDQMRIDPGPESNWFYALIGLTLAENLVTLDDARELVEQRQAELETKEAEDRANEIEEPSEGEEPGPEGQDPRVSAETATFSTILGQALLQEGRLDEAEAELETARELKASSLQSMLLQPFPYLYSGQLMEKRAESARRRGATAEAAEFLRMASEFYSEGVGVGYYANPELGMPWANPNETALEALYEQMHGNLDGFDDYLEAITDEGWEERQDRVLAGRIEDPEPMTAFSLETLSGEEVSSESLLGRVAVINFWGTW